MSEVNDNERLRKRFLEIRSEFSRLLDLDPPRRNKAIFYSGTSSSIPAFTAYLAKKNPAFIGARNLETTLAGKYLSTVTSAELTSIISHDYNLRRDFQLTNGASFSTSVNGFWRDLSSRFAQQCSGVVHVLVAHDRTRIHQMGLEMWARGVRSGGTLVDLKVFGFVEFPILIGALSENHGVTFVNIYVEDAPANFRLLQDSPHAISSVPGNS